MARPLASDGLRVAPPVSLEISCPQVRPRGLTTVPFSFRLTNRSSPELADAGTEVTARVALCRGAEHSELLDAPLPLALPVGAEHSLELPLHLPAFHGWYELQAQLLVGDRPLVEARLDLHLRHHVEELFLEVTNACNFRCDFCPQGELKRKPAILDLDLARKVLGDLRDMGHAHPIRLHLLGEPLLYPHFEELIGIVHEFGQTVRLATNGPRFDEATVEAILRSRVDELMISLNTPEREGFEERRGTRMDYDTYMASIHRMVDAVIERGSPPRTWVNVLYDGRRLGEPELLDEAHAFARPWFERSMNITCCRGTLREWMIGSRRLPTRTSRPSTGAAASKLWPR